MTRTNVRENAKYWAQVPSAGGVQIIVGDGDEVLNAAIVQAEIQYSQNRPRVRVVDATVTTAGFLQPLSGTGALLSDWRVGTSFLTAVWFPWTALQDAIPLDPTAYRLVDSPGGVASIWFNLNTPAVGQIIRFEYRTSHHVDDDATLTTVPDTDLVPFAVLTGFYLLTMAAVRAVQNTGNTGLPTDIVDRRTQSDIYKSRAGDLWKIYASAMGIGTIADTSKGDTGQPQSAFRDLNPEPGTPFGFLWRRRT